MPTVYTFTKKNAPGVNYTGASGGHYMNQPIDGARIAIQGIGNGPMTTDASASIVSSPVAVSPTSATTLTTPESAVMLTLIAATQSFKVSEVNASLVTYFPVLPGVPQTIDVGNCALLYVESAAATTATLSFFYTIV